MKNTLAAIRYLETAVTGSRQTGSSHTPSLGVGTGRTRRRSDRGRAAGRRARAAHGRLPNARDRTPSVPAECSGEDRRGYSAMRSRTRSTLVPESSRLGVPRLTARQYPRGAVPGCRAGRLAHAAFAPARRPSTAGSRFCGFVNAEESREMIAWTVERVRASACRRSLERAFAGNCRMRRQASRSP